MFSCGLCVWGLSTSVLFALLHWFVFADLLILLLLLSWMCLEVFVEVTVPLPLFSFIMLFFVAVIEEEVVLMTMSPFCEESLSDVLPTKDSLLAARFLSSFHFFRTVSMVPVWGSVEAMELLLLRCMAWLWFITCCWTIAKRPFPAPGSQVALSASFNFGISGETGWVFSTSSSCVSHLIVRGDGDGHLLTGLGVNAFSTSPMEPLLVRHGLFIILPNKSSFSLFTLLTSCFSFLASDPKDFFVSLALNDTRSAIEDSELRRSPEVLLFSDTGELFALPNASVIFTLECFSFTDTFGEYFPEFTGKSDPDWSFIWVSAFSEIYSGLSSSSLPIPCRPFSFLVSKFGDNDFRRSLKDPLLVIWGDTRIFPSISSFFPAVFGVGQCSPWFVPSLPSLMSENISKPFWLDDLLARLLDRLLSVMGVKEVIRSISSRSFVLPRLNRWDTIGVSTLRRMSDRANSSSLVSLELSWGEEDPVDVGDRLLTLQRFSWSSVYDKT